MNADWARLTAHLQRCPDVVTLTWAEFGQIVGQVPDSAIKHHPQWWHGDRPNTRAWRAAGFELDAVRPGEWVRFRRSKTVVPTREPVAVSSAPLQPADLGRRRAWGLFGQRKQGPQSSRREVANSAGPGHGLEVLARTHPRDCLVVLPCSAAKSAGGSPTVGEPGHWPESLLGARRALRVKAGIADGLRMPAWERYQGGLYQAAAAVLPEIAASGRLLILSGGYGLLDGTEPIGEYDREMRKGDWPGGLLESLLAQRAASTGLSVVAFAARTTDYRRILINTSWRLGEGRRALLVSIDGVAGGGAGIVPRRLGQALVAWWADGGTAYPEGVSVEVMADRGGVHG